MVTGHHGLVLAPERIERCRRRDIPVSVAGDRAEPELRFRADLLVPPAAQIRYERATDSEVS